MVCITVVLQNEERLLAAKGAVAGALAALHDLAAGGEREKKIPRRSSGPRAQIRMPRPKSMIHVSVPGQMTQIRSSGGLWSKMGIEHPYRQFQ